MTPSLKAAACAAVLALAANLPAQAQQAPEHAGHAMPHSPRHGAHHSAGQPTAHPHSGHHAQAGRHGQDGLMLPGGGMLRGLNLSEAQRDRVFAILHAQAPQMRAQAREAKKAREALHELTLSAELDDARLKEMAERASRAGTDLAVMRARTHQALFKELTPEQQAQLKARMDERRQRGAPHRAGMHGAHHAG